MGMTCIKGILLRWGAGAANPCFSTILQKHYHAHGDSAISFAGKEGQGRMRERTLWYVTDMRPAA